MQSFVFKHKRRVGGKVVLSRCWYGQYRLNGEAQSVRVALNVSDKQVAEKRLRDLVEEKQLEAAKIIPPKALRLAAQSSLTQHLDDYESDLVAKGRDAKYIYNVRHRVERLLDECGWKLPCDVNCDTFVAWRARQTAKSAKTKNEYLDAIRSMLTWMHRQGRLPANPLMAVGKVVTLGHEVRRRRALSYEEVRALLAVAGPRRAIYLLALYTGLRRSEIAGLRKCDLTLDCEHPFVRARASTTKNGKEAKLWLHRELVEAMRTLVKKDDAGEETLFAEVPSVSTLREDLAAAGIPFKDGEGRIVDFHAFRHTLATNLTRAGVSPRMAMEIMRHSDMRLTHKVYTDASLLPLREGVAMLPSFEDEGGEDDTQIRTQASGARGHSVSRDVAEARTGTVQERPENKGESHTLSRTVACKHDSKLAPEVGLGHCILTPRIHVISLDTNNFQTSLAPNA